MGDPATTTFALDTRPLGATGLSVSLRRWRAWLGAPAATPAYDPATLADLRIRFHQTRVHDALLHHHEGFSAVRAGKPTGGEGGVTLILVRRGSAELQVGRDTHAVPAGSFAIRRLDRPASFTNGPHTAGLSITLPGAGLVPVLGDRVARGPADTAEMRLLTAYANLLRRTAPDLSPPGARAARDALVELAAAVVRGAVGPADPRTAPALVQAAKELMAARLADRDLGPATLARELHVSTRTLQRAFAAGGESVAACIRDHRLGRARQDLVDAAGRLSVAEIAARWRFADGGHFSRAFKRRYGTTPTGYVADHTRAP
ncbi:helix-turn-helix domain-containing protein [Actinoplanes sp. NBRC 101535]|uniref:helix-turn-helix domain-containing protein n=1 Tax=Actinoplanes sp. NBRC 101535 TaxID=3032196 RepID=UPI0024A1C7F4|nr:helix-turn-helix domain-containing protein [Actinoplanes sp. NBRC 101535]GLY06605.1 transcriptional regulator [Actinoplanes sp. NBRC 101535]